MVLRRKIRSQPSSVCIRKSPIGKKKTQSYFLRSPVLARTWVWRTRSKIEFLRALVEI